MNLKMTVIKKVMFQTIFLNFERIYYERYIVLPFGRPCLLNRNVFYCAI